LTARRRLRNFSSVSTLDNRTAICLQHKRPIVAQVTAITKWGMAPKPTSLDSIQHPVLVANGDTDVMVPSINSVELARKLPHSELSIFPDAGHGAIFQCHSAFLDQTLRFLQN
jgi:pimeloyl-ACP methyl ester carboxylesterase